jgi:hypothetical protein
MKTANEQRAAHDAEADAQAKPNLRSKRNFAPEVYMRIGDDQLITLSLKLVIEDNKPPSFENVVEEAYHSFPERFSFQGRPEWPHTLVIDRSIRRCATDGKNDGFLERRQPVISCCLSAKRWRKTPTKNCEAKDRLANHR